MSEVNLEIEEKPKSVLEKPKRVRTQKQIDATAKLVASNKLKREAKKADALKNNAPTPVAVVPPVPVVVETIIGPANVAATSAEVTSRVETDRPPANVLVAVASSAFIVSP